MSANLFDVLKHGNLLKTSRQPKYLFDTRQNCVMSNRGDKDFPLLPQNEKMKCKNFTLESTLYVKPTTKAVRNCSFQLICNLFPTIFFTEKHHFSGRFHIFGCNPYSCVLRGSQETSGFGDFGLSGNCYLLRYRRPKRSSPKGSSAISCIGNAKLCQIFDYLGCSPVA